MDERPPAIRLLGPVLATSVVSSLAASILTVAVLGGLPSIASSSAQPSATTSPNAVTASATSTPSTAQTAASAGGSNPVVAVAAKVSPAVVTISSSSGAIGLFGVQTGGVGSGFIFKPNGYILTNNHVIDGASQLTVTLEDGRQFDATVIASDPQKDLAVVKVDATGLPTVEIGSSANLQVGQLVVAIGSPLGTFTDSVTSGILSALGRTVTVTDAATRQRHTITNLLQTDAAINEGNSGGPLLDANGRVVGINTAAVSSADGLGFAIPIDEAASILSSASA